MKTIFKVSVLLIISLFILINQKTERISAEEYKGMCGENASWKFDTITGILEITGSGEMDDYNLDGTGDKISSPWRQANLGKNIKEIRITGDITKIGNAAFYNCSGVNTVVMSNSVKIVAADSFDSCINLHSVTLSKDVEVIEKGAFNNCDHLQDIYYNGTIEKWCNIEFSDTYSNPMYYAEHFYMLDNNNEYYEVTEITISEGPTTINGNQFLGFDYLTKVVIPETVTSINITAFSNCSLLNTIYLPKSLKEITEQLENCPNLFTVYYSGNMDNWLNIDFQYPKSNPMLRANQLYVLDENNQYIEETILIVPNGIQTIKNQCIGLRNVIKIILPNSVTLIEQQAFWNCENLESINIPEGVENLNEIFTNCQSLKEITINNSVTRFCSSIFIDTVNLEKIYYQGSLHDWLEISFSTPTSNPMIHAEKLYLYDENLDYYELTDLVIPSDVTTIGQYQFYGGASITTVSIHQKVIDIYIGAFAFQKDVDIFYNPISCQTVEKAFQSIDSNAEVHIIVGENVEDINLRYNEMTKVSFSEKTTISELVDYEFRDCTKLKEINIPSTCIKIGHYAFYNCTSLEKINFTDSIVTIGQGAFSNCTSLKDIVLPDSVNTLGDRAFNYCINLENITIPKRLAIIGNNFESTTNLQNVYYKGTINDWGKINFTNIYGNPTVYAKQLYLLNDKNEYYNVLNSEEIELSSDVFKIGSYQFVNFTNLKNIILPNNITQIGEYAFASCISLEKITIPGGIVHIGNNVFYNVPKLNDVYFDGTIEDWCKIRFSEEYSTPMFYAKNLYMLDENNEYHELKEVVIPTSITTISDFAFYNIPSIEKIIIHKDVTSVGVEAFAKCHNLKEVVFEEGSKVSVFNYGLFNYSENLEKITMPDSLISIDNYVFTGCQSLKEIYIPKTVTNIKSGTFLYNSFGECNSLEKIIVDEDNQTYSSDEFGVLYNKNKSHLYTFPINNQLEEFVIPTEVKYIMSYSFLNANNLQKLYIGKNVFVYNEALNILPHTTLYVYAGSYADSRIDASKCMEKIAIYEETLIGLEIAKLPEKTVFDYRYQVDFKGLEVLANYGEIQVPIFEYNITYDNSIVGEQLAIITYEVNEQIFTTTFSITINQKAILGDLDNNEVIDTEDVIYLLMHTLFPNSYQVETPCDYTKDGKVDTEDVIYLLMHTLFPDAYPL